MPDGVVGAADHQGRPAVWSDKVSVTGRPGNGDCLMGIVPDVHVMELVRVIAVSERLFAPAPILWVPRWRRHGCQAQEPVLVQILWRKKGKDSIYSIIHFPVMSKLRKSSASGWESRSFSIWHWKKEAWKDEAGNIVLTQLLLHNSYHRNKCKSKNCTTRLSHNWQHVRTLIVAGFPHVNACTQTQTSPLSNC